MRRSWPAVALALMLFLPGTATAASTWLPSREVGPPTSKGAAVGMAADGTAIAAFVSQDPGRVTVRIRPPGGDWGPPQPLSEPGSVSAPLLAVAPGGHAVVAWQVGGQVWTAMRAPGGDFGGAEPFSGVASSPLIRDVGITSDGTAVVLWDGGSSSVQAGVRPSGSPAGAAQTLDQVNPNDGTFFRRVELSRVAADGLGGAIAVWQFSKLPQGGGSYEFEIRASTRPPGGQFGPFETVRAAGAGGGEEALDSPDVAADAQGNSVIAWATGDVTEGPLEAAFRPAGGPAGQHVTLSNDGVGPRVGMDAAGNAIVAWRSTGVLARVRPAGGDFGDVAQLIDDGANDLAVEMNAAGQALVFFLPVASPLTVRAVARPPGGPFGPAEPVAVAPQDESFTHAAGAIDGQGNGVAAWDHQSGTDSLLGDPTRLGPPSVSTVETAGYDAAGPRFDSLSIPATGAAGAALPFSVAAVDVWSPFSIGWNFGDSKTATGNPTTHTYATPGSRTVTLTGTDSLGNVATATRNLNVGVDFARAGLSAFGMLRKTFAVGPKATPVSSVRKGTAFRFTLSEPARVRIVVERQVPGVRVGKRCRVATPRLRRGKKRRACKAYKRAGTLARRNRKTGRNSITFSGRVGRKALSAGRYRATATGTNAAGVNSAAKRVSFRVVRIKRRRR